MAGIIKAGTSLPAGFVSTAKGPSWEEADDSYLGKIRQEASTIIAQAQAQADQIRRTAMEEGKKAAMEATEAMLRAKIEQQLQSVVQALRSAIQSILAAREQWQRHWEQHALQLSSAIAARIVRREVEKVPLITVDLVREALQLAAGNQRVTLRVAPTDFTALKPHIEQLISQLSSVSDTRVIADPNITAGGCRVDTEFGSIDQQFEAQLARILEELD